MPKKTATIMSLLMVMGLMALMSCSENPITGNQFEPVMKEAIPSAEITWLSWKPEALARLSSRDAGSQTKEINADRWGKVGNGSTFHNKVEFPIDALSESQEITIEVLNTDGNKQVAAGVDFLPSQQFNCDVKVTLSWAYLDVAEEDYAGLDFHIYFSEDDGASWYEVSDPIIDYHKQTISVWVDHFTRYAWGL